MGLVGFFEELVVSVGFFDNLLGSTSPRRERERERENETTKASMKPIKSTRMLLSNSTR